MKLAFTSCICTAVHPAQAVWDQIAAQQPDHLLLGDSIYIDVPWIGFNHPKQLPPADFQQHLLDDAIDVAFFQQGAPDTKVRGQRIDRAAWRTI